MTEETSKKISLIVNHKLLSELCQSQASFGVIQTGWQATVHTRRAYHLNRVHQQHLN